MEALCRDLYCYCIQANSSDFGDSRVIAPKKTEERDLIKTKGGLNCVVLSEELDIEALRDFQMLEFELQQEKKTFKPSPPITTRDIEMIQAKIDGTLLNYRRI